MVSQRQDALTDYLHRALQRWLPLVAVLLTAATLLPEAAAAPASAEAEPPTPTPGDAALTATRRSYIPMAGNAASAPLPSSTPRPSATPAPEFAPRPSATPEPDPTPEPSATPAPAPPDTSPSGDGRVVQGLFFAKPQDGTSTSTVAQRASWMTLTRGHARWLRELRDAGYSGQAFQYWIGMEVQGPGPYKNSSARCDGSFVPAGNTVAYDVGDFCAHVHPNEGWFVHNGRGERLLYERPDGSWDYQMNPASEGWRAFVRDRSLRDLVGEHRLGFDGVYFDNVRMRLYNLKNQLHNSDGRVREFEGDAEYRAEMVNFLRYQRAAIRDVGKELWGSLIDFYGVSEMDYLRFTDQLDGYMSEAWGPGYLGREVGEDHWNTSLSIAETTLEQGKRLMAVVQGEQDDHTRQTFGLASYLLVGDGQNAFFRYAYLREPYTEWWQYRNYDVELGEAKGARYKSGNLWRRDFRCGYVTVDVENQRGAIVQTCS